MTRIPALLVLAFLLAVPSGPPLAQSTSPTAPATPSAVPGVVTEGAASVSVGGVPAARTGDRTSGGASVVQGSRDVFIGGRPAATVGDATGCGGLVIGGSSNVFVNGKPLAGAGALTTGCPGQGR